MLLVVEVVVVIMDHPHQVVLVVEVIVVMVLDQLLHKQQVHLELLIQAVEVEVEVIHLQSEVPVDLVVPVVPVLSSLPILHNYLTTIPKGIRIPLLGLKIIV
jgi:hypothetical protein